MKILHLTLKKKWFDMIASGEKKEEYREIKRYWHTRLIDRKNYLFKHFDVVVFKNGYGKNAPKISVECKGVAIGTGYTKWGANGESFVIKLGKIIS